jgi:hypothetical protein
MRLLLFADDKKKPSAPDLSPIAIRRALRERRELNARYRGLKAMSQAMAMTRPNDEELTDAKDVSDDA